jgi:hypothetical protein
MTRLTLALYLAAFGLIGLNVGRYVLSPAEAARPSAVSVPTAVAVPSTSALATDGADRGDAG